MLILFGVRNSDDLDALVEAHAAQNRVFTVLSVRVGVEEVAEGNECEEVDRDREERGGSCDGDDTLAFFVSLPACFCCRRRLGHF